MSNTVEQETAEKIVVKNHWKEVNLQTFIEIGMIQADTKFKDLKLQQRFRMIALLSNWSYAKILKLDSENIGPIIESTSFIDREPPKKRKKKPFKINGIDHIFHPNFKNLTAGEMISVEQLIMDAEHNGVNSTPGVLAVLIRPTKQVQDLENGGTKSVIEEFDAESWETRKTFLLQHLTVDKFYHELAFFLTIGENKNLDSLLSTESNPDKKKPKKKK